MVENLAVQAHGFKPFKSANLQARMLLNCMWSCKHNFRAIWVAPSIAYVFYNNISLNLQERHYFIVPRFISNRCTYFWVYILSYVYFTVLLYLWPLCYETFSSGHHRYKQVFRQHPHTFIRVLTKAGISLDSPPEKKLFWFQPINFNLVILKVLKILPFSSSTFI